MGSVYEATQLSLNRKVALKVLAPELSDDVVFRERFRREGQIQAAIDHPHIVNIYEAGESEHGLFLAMRLVRGPTLKDLIVGGELDAGRTLRLLAPVFGALDTAHAAGLIHRDIKPQNILVGDRDHAYLTDFGLTKAAGEESLTGTGQILGTLDYMSPEQIQSERPTTRSDVYALGALLYECLAGTVPFPRHSDAAVLYAHVADPPPRLSDQRSGMPAELDEVLCRALAKDPAERHQSAMELWRDAERAFGETPPSTFAPPRPAKRPRTTATVPATSTRPSAPVGPAPLGRTAECARIDSLLDAARRGRSGTLLLRGEPGIGKSTLLGYAAERASDMTVLAARGVESETKLPFAGLSELFRSVKDWLALVPAGQSAVLRGALALGPPKAGHDRFAVCAATLGLLGAVAVAQDRPLLCLIDDAHWIDTDSREALQFAARRLEAEGVAMLFAARDGDEFEVTEFEELRVGPLEPDAAATLVAAHTSRPPVDEVSKRLAHETAGNPLALLELSKLLTDGQLAGRQPLAEPLPAGEWVRRAYGAQIRGLSDTARLALMVAAASGEGEVGPILEAADALGASAGALEAVEQAGLVTVADATLAFRHPLVRSAAYAAATPGERRSAHQALAKAVSDERRAWHLAAAAFGPDEDVAQALEEAADGARGRSGYVAAAAALERAALLSPAKPARAKRLVAAADDARRGGYDDQALRLLGGALEYTSDARMRAATQHARGRIELFRGRSHAAYELLATEALEVQSVDPDRAATMLAEAALASLLAGDAPTSLDTAQQAASAIETEGGVAELITNLMLGIALYRVGRTREGLKLVLPATEIAEREGGRHLEPEYVVHAAHMLVWAGEYGRAKRLLAGVTDRARATGALGVLPFALYVSSSLDTRTGRWTSAYADAFEAVRVAEDTDNDFWRCYALACLALIEAGQGREEQCRAHAGQALSLSYSLDMEYPREIGDALGLLELGLGRPEAAIQHLEPVTRVTVEQPGEPILARPSVADLVEAYVRAGRPDSRELVARLEGQTGETGTAWFRALLARCQGLVAAEGQFDAWFGEALELHDVAGMPFPHARTALCYGERLRRSGRVEEARRQLRSAFDTFGRLGASAWSGRAEDELLATGEAVHRPEAGVVEKLTPEELQVALIVARGATSREAGAALFMTTKTVRHHLGRTYRKLGVRSRSELADLLADSEHELAAPVRASPVHLRTGAP